MNGKLKQIELKTVSASKLRLYNLCPRQYYYAYGEGIVQKESIEMVYGNYLHEVLENYLKNLLITRNSQDLAALYKIAKDQLANYEMIKETGPYSQFEADIMLNKFASKKIDPYFIYAIEKFFRISLPGIEEPKLIGRFDRIDLEKDDSHSLLHIIDYKTGKNKLSEDDLADDLQMRFYIVASFFFFRKHYTSFRFSLYYLRDSTRVSFETEINDEMIERLRKNIEKLAEDTEYRKNISSHCLRCPALKICKPDMKLVKAKK